MNWKRTVMLTLLLAVVGTAAVYADNIYETIRAKKVTVMIDDQALDSRSYEVRGDVLVPLDEIAESLQAVVLYDGDQVKIYKPNIHMSILASTKNNGVELRSTIKYGERLKFAIRAEGLSHGLDIESMKFEIVNPKGQVDYEEIVAASKDVKKLPMFMSHTGEISHYFSSAGDYTFNLYMKLKGSNDYHLVSKKVIHIER